VLAGGVPAGEGLGDKLLRAVPIADDDDHIAQLLTPVALLASHTADAAGEGERPSPDSGDCRVLPAPEGRPPDIGAVTVSGGGLIPVIRCPG
jgi:hypothetical protein